MRSSSCETSEGPNLKSFLTFGHRLQFNKALLRQNGLKTLWALAFFAAIYSADSFATEVIQFPEEELATESVLPVFDRPDSVKNRNVPLSRRLELGAQYGYALTQPFYNPMSLGGTLGYHINEEHGINLLGLVFLPGLSSEAAQLNPIPGSSPAVNMNLQYAPAPKYLFLASWQYSSFYGKLSITKDIVMNLHLFGLAGAGVYGIGDSNNPAVNVGIGQKFYFGKAWALRFDLRGLVYRGPDVLSVALNSKTTVQPSSSFDQKIFIDGLINVGVSYVFPGF